MEKENVVKKKKKIAIDADEELAPKTRRKKSEEDVGPDYESKFSPKPFDD